MTSLGVLSIALFDSVDELKLSFTSGENCRISIRQVWCPACCVLVVQSTEAAVVCRRARMCGHHGCTKWPIFGVEGRKARQFCSQHATAGMVDVVSKRCGHPGCTKKPSYGVEGSKTTEFCSQHAKKGMVEAQHKK